MIPPEKPRSPEQRFREDPVEILREACRAVGKPLDPEMEGAMLCHAHLLADANPEPLFDALCKLILLVTVEDMLRFGPILAEGIPELKPLLGFDQRSPHHAYDLFTHVAHVVAGVPTDLTLRWAALLHDIGKIPTFTQDETGRGHFYGHAGAGAKMADAVLRRLKAPDALRIQVTTLIEKHMTKLEPEKESVSKAVETLGYETVDALLYLQEADMASKGVGIPPEMEQFPRLRGLLAELREDGR